MEEQYLTINNLSAYKISFDLSNKAWDIVIKWSFFEKDTVGKQFVRSIDSISANIAEGFGRFSKKDKIRFYYYSLGSTLEALDWSKKSYIRGIISSDDYAHIRKELDKLPREINQLIKFTNQKLKY